MDIERRKARSEHRAEAIELYLGALARRSGMRAVALADQDGLLVAGAGPRQVLDQLAAVGAMSTANQGCWRELLDEIGATSLFCCYRLDVAGLRFQLAALGGVYESRDDVVEDLSRILLS